MITLRILRWGMYGGIFAVALSVAGIFATSPDCSLCPVFGVIVGGPGGFFIGIAIGLIVEGGKPGFRQNIDGKFYAAMSLIFTAFCVYAYVAVSVLVDIWDYYS